MKTHRKRAQLGTIPIEMVLPLIGLSSEAGKCRHQVTTAAGEVFTVKTGSHRLLLFLKNRICVSCGREGTHFILERDLDHISPHLNLYSDCGILMTKDHIIPKSKGGKDDMSNYQTMCEICNAKKADNLELLPN